jgi:glycosyltransferase involved in cell wall biosynthesis
MAQTSYLVPASIGRLCRAHGYFLLQHCAAYVGTLCYLLALPHPTLWRRFRTLRHFGVGVLAADLLRGAGVDHVHAHFADRAGVVAMVISRLLGMPYSVTAHAFDIYVDPLFLAQKIQGARFATTCTAANQSHIRAATGERVELIYHGLDFDRLPAGRAPDGAGRRPLILAVGRLQEKKGFVHLLRACALLRERGIRIDCEIIGEGPERARLSALIDELALGDSVRLSGALPHALVLEKYREAACFVLPCIIAEDGDRDGIPNVILEAMACALPVISTRVSGVPEVVVDGQTGILLETADPERIAAAVAGLLESPTVAEALGRNAADFVRREFDIRRNVVRLIELLSEAAPSGVTAVK